MFVVRCGCWKETSYRSDLGPFDVIHRTIINPTFPASASMWTVIVSASGTMKSPAWALAKEPLDAIQSAAFAEYRQA